jgi:hypothetical protein
MTNPHPPAADAGPPRALATAEDIDEAFDDAIDAYLTLNRGTEAQAEAAALRKEWAARGRFAAAWKRLCAIDRAWPKTHRRPMLPLGVMGDVNRLALGADDDSEPRP